MRLAIVLLLFVFGGLPQANAPAEADDVLAQLSKIRLDRKQVYTIRDFTLRRDVLSFSINRGAIAFLEPVNGKVTGAVFVGSGEIVAIPPNPIERQQIFRYTGTPVLNESFHTAIFRFTDNTYEELRNELSQRAQEDVDRDDLAELEKWEAALAQRTAGINLRLLPDFLEPGGGSLFLAEVQGEKRGWFTLSVDSRAVEEVSIFQLRQIGSAGILDVWGSFNQRSEARNLEATAHESKVAADILSSEVERKEAAGIDATATMRLKARKAGARVLSFELASSLRVTSIADEAGQVVPSYPFPDSGTFLTVLPRPLTAGQEITLRIAYNGPSSGSGPWVPSQRQQMLAAVKSNLPLPDDKTIVPVSFSGRRVLPASYHDQWLLDGLGRYLPALSAPRPESVPELRSMLNDARQALKFGENAGPIWLGRRLGSSLDPDGYRIVPGKALWVIHMLRGVMKGTGADPDAPFMAAVNEFFQTYDGAAASTWDFKRIAEKHASRKLDWFFDQWVFATGLPSYSIEYKIESAGNEFVVEGTLDQTGVPDGFAMPVPLYADSNFLGTVQVGDSDGRFLFRTTRKPDTVLIDPEGSILTAP